MNPTFLVPWHSPYLRSSDRQIIVRRPDFNPARDPAFGTGFEIVQDPIRFQRTTSLMQTGRLGVSSSRTIAERLSCSFLLLGFSPMHSDSQQCVIVAS